MINYMMLEGRLINDPQPIKLEKKSEASISTGI